MRTLIAHTHTCERRDWWRARSDGRHEMMIHIDPQEEVFTPILRACLAEGVLVVLYYYKYLW